MDLRRSAVARNQRNGPIGSRHGNAPRLSSSLFLAPDAEEAKARGSDFAVSPGPSVRCVREAAPRLFYARAARHCPVLEEDGIAVRERTFRGYYCRRCGVAVCICSECDVG